MTISLENFEGPIDLLFQLIQQSEIDIYEVKLRSITEQFMDYITRHPLAIDMGAEFISTAAALVWLKSKTLLPPKEQECFQPEEEEDDPHFDIIHHLVDYCRFKEAAKQLTSLEQQQKGFYSRGMTVGQVAKRPLGIEHLSLEDIAGLFKVIAAKSIPRKGVVEAETWKLADKIDDLRLYLAEVKKINFYELFSYDKLRLELIVTFLAVLELMKLGEVSVIREIASGELFITSRMYEFDVHSRTSIY